MFDKFFSLILVVLFFPLMIIVAILIYLWDGRPILFVQKRPGDREYINFAQ